MSKNNFLQSLQEENPRYLLNLFNLLVVASFVVIMGVAGSAIYAIYSSSMLRHTETTVIGIGKAMLSAEVDSLLAEDKDGALRIAIAPAALPQVDAQMRRYLKFFNLRKIMIRELFIRPMSPFIGQSIQVATVL